MAVTLTGPHGKTVSVKEYTSKMDPGASPVEKYANGHGGQVTRIWQCLWGQRHAAMIALLGYSEREKGLADKFVIKRYLPHSYLPSGSTVPLYATEVSQIVGKGGPSDGVTEGADGVTQYDTAFLTTTYQALPYKLLPDDQMLKNSDGNPDETRMGRYIAYSVKCAGGFLSLPNGFAVFNDSATLFSLSCSQIQGKAFPGGGIIEPTGEFTIKWYQVPEKCVPSVLVNPDLQSVSTLGNYDNYVGKVNSVAFLGLGIGKVLCMPADFGEPKKSVIGTIYYDVSYKFKYDPNGFSRAWCTPAGTYINVTRQKSFVNGGTEGLYEKADLRSLFVCQGG